MNIQNLRNNSRFYILLSAVSVSIVLACWLRLTTESSQLFGIRIQQLYGYAAILLWYSALIITPLGKALPRLPGLKHLLFGRRALGVAAAYFALLHVGIAFWGQVGGFEGIALLPERFRLSLVFGVIAAAILTAMAVTSFDKVIAWMTFPRWKWLHRLGYIGGILVLLHIWMIGTHMDYFSFRSITLIMLALLFWVESIRITGLLIKKFPSLRFEKIVVVIALWTLAMTATVILPAIAGTYRNTHAGDTSHAP